MTVAENRDVNANWSIRRVESVNAVERRSGERYPIRFAAAYHRINEAPVRWPATIIDISARGLRFAASEGALQTGEWITVSIAWPARCGGSVPVTLLVHGVVVRSSPTEAALRAIRYEFDAEPCGASCTCRQIASRPAAPELDSGRQLHPRWRSA